MVGATVGEDIATVPNITPNDAPQTAITRFCGTECETAKSHQATNLSAGSNRLPPLTDFTSGSRKTVRGNLRPDCGHVKNR